MSKPAILVLEDGSIFRGISIGADGESIGEVVFNTSMHNLSWEICQIIIFIVFASLVFKNNFTHCGIGSFQYLTFVNNIWTRPLILIGVLFISEEVIWSLKLNAILNHLMPI